MTSIEVDGSLLFRFLDDWDALDWEATKERQKQRAGHRKAVDVAATGPAALLVEVKDDRIKDAAAKGRRKKAVQKGAFLEDMALKFRHSTEDILRSRRSRAGDRSTGRSPRGGSRGGDNSCSGGSCRPSRRQAKALGMTAGRLIFRRYKTS